MDSTFLRTGKRPIFNQRYDQPKAIVIRQHPAIWTHIFRTDLFLFMEIWGHTFDQAHLGERTAVAGHWKCTSCWSNHTTQLPNPFASLHAGNPFPSFWSRVCINFGITSGIPCSGLRIVDLWVHPLRFRLSSSLVRYHQPALLCMILKQWYWQAWKYVSTAWYLDLSTLHHFHNYRWKHTCNWFNRPASANHRPAWAFDAALQCHLHVNKGENPTMVYIKSSCHVKIWGNMDMHGWQYFLSSFIPANRKQNKFLSAMAVPGW